MEHFDERLETEALSGAVLQYLKEDNDPRSGSSGCDVHHDPWLIPESIDLKALASSIFEQLEASHPRPTRQRSDAKVRRNAILDNIIASLALASTYYPEGTRIVISAKNVGLTRYDREDFSREVFMQVIGELHKDGLLILHRGARTNRRRSTIQPTSTFHQMLAGREISIGRERGAETIILKASTGRNRTKQLIDYRDTPDTIAMRDQMQAVNENLGAATILLCQEALPLRVHLTRRFQIDHQDAPHTFDRHGRLYGGFWMSLPKDERYLLRVNGEEVVDLDFAGMFVQLAYLEAGAALPNRDPYGGLDGLPRSVAKIGLSALLCRSGPMQRLPEGLRDQLGPGWNAKRLVAALEERHPRIAHLFGHGVGLKLMKLESDILLETLRLLFQQGIPALPMHDGIMVPASSEEAARRAMARGFMNVVGTSLPIARKEVPKPLAVNSPPMD